MRTATPFFTWSRITEYGPSATSGDSSTPRFTGPGCMISTSGRHCCRRATVRPHTREYSRTDGMKPPCIRSCCRRSIMMTSAWAMAHHHAQVLTGRRDQRRRPRHRHRHAHRLHSLDVRARHAAVRDVAHDGDVEPVEVALLLPD